MEMNGKTFGVMRMGPFAIEIVPDADLCAFLRGYGLAASPPQTPEQLIHRWLSFGLARDVQKPIGEAEMIWTNGCRIIRK